MTSDDFLRAEGEPLRELLRRDYELDGALSPLPGEADLNLRLCSDDGDYLVKVRADKKLRILAFQ